MTRTTRWERLTNHTSRFVVSEPPTVSIPPGDYTPKSRRSKLARVSSLKAGILDNLGLYMKYARRMKKYDPEAYATYSRLGAQLQTRSDRFVHGGRLEPWFLEKKPSFGCVSWGVGQEYEDAEEGSDKIYPKFIYFQKFERFIPGVQMSNRGVTYKVTAYFDSLSGSKEGLPVSWFIVLDEEGGITPLLVLHEDQQTIQHRQGPWRGHSSHVSHQRWGLPSLLRAWSAENDRTPQDFARRVFCAAANAWQFSAMEMIRIGATKNRVTASFSIDVTTTPGMFDDRSITVGKTGKKARIFHIVRAHTRTLANGRVLKIKAHFSGLPDFTWNGYQIKITVPGRDHASIAEFAAAAFDESAQLPTEDDCISIDQAAEFMADRMGVPA